MQYEKPQLSITIKQFLTISGQFLTLKLKKKKQKNALKRIHMLAFCVYMYFQLKFISLGLVQTDVDYYMVTAIDPIY